MHLSARGAQEVGLSRTDHARGSPPTGGAKNRFAALYFFCNVTFATLYITCDFCMCGIRTELSDVSSCLGMPWHGKMLCISTLHNNEWLCFVCVQAVNQKYPSPPIKMPPFRVTGCILNQKHMNAAFVLVFVRLFVCLQFG